jgi:hypothetical protein
MPPSFKCLEIDGLFVRRALLPTVIQDAKPFACPGPHGGLRGFALVALLLGVAVPRRHAGLTLPPMRRTVVGGT